MEFMHEVISHFFAPRTHVPDGAAISTIAGARFHQKKTIFKYLPI